jgi:hypothetical protein
MRIQDFNKFKLNERLFGGSESNEEFEDNLAAAYKILDYIKDHIESYRAGNKVIFAPGPEKIKIERVRVKESKNRLKITFWNQGKEFQKSITVGDILINEFKKLIETIQGKSPKPVKASDFGAFIKTL